MKPCPDTLIWCHSDCLARLHKLITGCLSPDGHTASYISLVAGTSNHTDSLHPGCESSVTAGCSMQAQRGGNVVTHPHARDTKEMVPSGTVILHWPQSETLFSRNSVKIEEKICQPLSFLLYKRHLHF